MTIYNIADMLTGLFEAMMMFSLFGTLFVKRDAIPKCIYVLGIFALAIFINISNYLTHYGILNALGMILSFFAISFLYKGNILIKLIVSVLTFLLMVLAEIIVLFGVTLIFELTVTEAVDIPEYRLLGIIASKLLTFFIINIIRIKFKDKTLMFRPIYWILFFIIFGTTIVAEFLIFKLSYDVGNPYLNDMSIWCAFGLLFSTFFVLYLYENLAKQAETIKTQAQYEQHLKTQLKNIDDILITQKQFKKFKHDFNNFRIGLKAYIKENDFQGADSYIDELEEKFNHTENVVETGNTAFDAILNTKIAIAESKGIKVNTKLQIPEKMSVEPIDLCVIFGNALDNAIEACEKVKTSNKEINITIMCKDTAIFCRIANTAPDSTVPLHNTSKLDKSNHGFGLENIRTSLMKYNAMPIIERTDTLFVLKFVIFTKE